MANSGDFFNYTKRKKYVALQLSSALPWDVTPEFHQAASEMIEAQQHIIVSCPGAAGFAPEWLKVFEFMAQQLKINKKKVCFIHTEDALVSELENSPEKNTFACLTTLDQALSAPWFTENVLTKMNYIKVFVACTLRTLFIQAQLQSSQGKISVLDQAAPEKLLGDISGIILVESAEYSYVLVISFLEKTYLQIMSTWLGETYTKLDEEIGDGAAELMNIIYGQAKLLLNSRGAGIKPSIPFIAFGRNIPKEADSDRLQTARLHLATGKTVVIPFDSPAGTFFVQVCFPIEFAEKLMAPP